jgi:hypothetical protein
VSVLDVLEPYAPEHAVVLTTRDGVVTGEYGLALGYQCTPRVACANARCSASVRRSTGLPSSGNSW